MNRSFHSSSIDAFIARSPDEVLGKIVTNNPFSLEQMQRNAWIEEIRILKRTLKKYNGSIYFEYTVPRMGHRIDVLVLIEAILFALEFKVNETEFTSYAIDQVWDYALDLKNFHETSHNLFICPVLIATKAPSNTLFVSTTPHNDKLLFPVKCNSDQLNDVIDCVLSFSDGKAIDPEFWESGRYCPTPTIVEAAMALYNGHSVDEISRNDASAINLTLTSDCISSIIRNAKERSQKAICFVTGVPGAGKTLVGLNIATEHFDKSNELYSVFLSGNGPLVSILREALARDKVERSRKEGKPRRKSEVMSEVKMFIQNVHHFRDDCLIDDSLAPIEHVALFDEAQRAWNKEHTSMFMRLKKKISNFHQSEPDFLISCLNRHKDWAVIVCLVGGGQEINTGEAGISEWIEALDRGFEDWHVYISPNLTDSEYTAKNSIDKLKNRPNVMFKNNLHLSVSMRSFRAEDVSLLVKQVLDIDIKGSQETYQRIKNRFPIAITRNVRHAKKWLKQNARGSERYGIVVSSQAERLKPHAIDVRSPMDPIHWFLDGKEDVRSSYYLESVATEFHIQGLELDWVCVTWDADFRYSPKGWKHWSFRGSRWTKIRKEARKMYLKNAYRVFTYTSSSRNDNCGSRRGC